MWQDKLKEIIYILENSDVNEIDLNFWGRRFRVVKSVAAGGNAAPTVVQAASSPPASVPAAVPVGTESEPTTDSAKGEEILSPMPGTFYNSPSPEADVFVKVGDKVSEGDTLCIIEAMKIMNEIEAEIKGTITKILIEDGQAVEYNQPLFVIDPS